MIKVIDIVKQFDDTIVLNHVSTEMYDGQVNMIIGQSGSGKTVLLKSLIGLHSVDSGNILYMTSNGEQDLARLKEKEFSADINSAESSPQ